MSSVFYKFLEKCKKNKSFKSLGYFGGTLCMVCFLNPLWFCSWSFRGYNNPNWRDQLTSFNGAPLIYDEVGNMVRGLGLQLEWNGSNATRIERDGIVSEFTYNSDGMISSITIDGIITTFLLDGYRVRAESSSDGQIIVYLFDHEDGLLGFELNGYTYFYVTNPLGDIIAILNSNLEIVVEYSYDAWGNILDITGPKAETIGRINPYRYRGYRFVESTGLYFVGGRFYSPEIGRFISPRQDVGTIGNSISHNLYAYALNNPMANGYQGISPTSVKVITVFFVAITLALVLTLMYTAHQLTVTNVNHINGSGNALISQFGNPGRDLANEGVSILRNANNALANSRTRTTRHNHHIIARAHASAAPARNIYGHYWRPLPSSLDHSRNIVSIRQSIHSRMHSTAYFNAVNGIIRVANGGDGMTGRSVQVNGALSMIATFLAALSFSAP